jgi:hypothetical protein
MFLSAPSRSATEMRTTYGFNDDGTLRDVSYPRSKSTRTLYDNLDGGDPEPRERHALGRVGGRRPVIAISFADGLRTSMWVDLDGDDAVDGTDQVTTY